MIAPLVELCLNSVAENLARHHLLFTTSVDFYNMRKLEFLQKKYSPNLISRLCVEDGLPEEFIDILVNKYTKFLDTRWFKKCSLDKFTSKLAEIGCNLEKILCNYGCMTVEFSGAIRDSICHLTNLKSFTLRSKCNDWILKNVAKFCRNIEEIDVKGSAITSEGVKYLCRDKNGKVLCTALKKLCFGFNWHIKDKDLEYLLKNLPSLEVIDHPDLLWVLHSLHKENLPSLSEVLPYNITTLDLIQHSNSCYFFFADIVKICAVVCPRLKYFSCKLIREQQLNCLFDLPELEKLFISNDLNFQINIDSFLICKGSQLTSLNIELCTVSVSVLAENCPCLKELILQANILGDENSKPVFHSLSSLTFFGGGMGITHMLLSSLIKLESLSFKSCTSTLKYLDVKVAILKCCELYPVKKITFSSSWIEKKFIKNLLCVCRTLQYLALYNCFNRDEFFDGEDLLDFAKLLPNKPIIHVTD